MTYFTWKEEGLTNDCETLDSMAARFEESARLMRKMSAEGFKLEKRNKRQIITHIDILYPVCSVEEFNITI